jgi:hypothetical protein
MAEKCTQIHHELARRYGIERRLRTLPLLNLGGRGRWTGSEGVPKTDGREAHANSASKAIQSLSLSLNAGKDVFIISFAGVIYNDLESHLPIASLGRAGWATSMRFMFDASTRCNIMAWQPERPCSLTRCVPGSHATCSCSSPTLPFACPLI